jgi:hypothetical protein
MLRVSLSPHLASRFVVSFFRFDVRFYALCFLLFHQGRLLDLLLLLTFVSLHDSNLNFFTIFRLVVYLWTAVPIFFMSATESRR